ncbi:aminotransferase class I/II-fold pyridoxal phosphate-dependent enzyme [Psychrobacillus psychrodurans]|uniref:aminotransferase class I/II-fold pyridoxal phosphate-dependent enzyme n=1 Tax=Psychrobacillus psychrodurans TaxID=126157 RepID=UPI0008EC32EC|nr:aminotransferase class I/II-fold pyridoxal phosphate-dependent enzyme [Psychrobacillus psychrodurans]MCZ8542048.1 aminotransferase class I/II-fold pyridoxal phosphate-dependent enzyme [Psychrobacillus psychrodurans]SFN15535.1 Arginine/lysine/ornithine decarboxylase [Psychrobacillus psychrodurans]
MQEKRPLVEALEKFHKNSPISFHVPGHKNGLLSNLPELIRDSMQYDLTELNGLDDYHHPDEAIKEAEQLLTKLYNTDESFFLVNGTTIGNLAMIYATCQYGEQIIVQRNAHKSIFHAIELVGAEPIFVSPKWDEQSKTASYVSLEVIEEAIQQFPFVKAVVLTYPNYYGVSSPDLENIIRLCHKLQMPVLVDEAHGAHFQSHKGFPKSALLYGADIVVQSAHKTLPALTMGSFLHIRSQFIDSKKVNKYLRMLQSSSPSYLILASLDDARSYVERYSPMDFKQLMDRREVFIQALETIPLIKVVQVDDHLKLLIRVGKYSGFQVQQAFEKQNIYVELADPHQVLLILPLLKVEHEYAFAEIRKRIKHAVDNLKKESPDIKNNVFHMEQRSISTLQMSMEQLSEKQGEWIPYVRTIGKIAKGMIIPYPPGIPLILPGEKITVPILTELEEWIEKGALFQGEHRLEEKLIYVVEE